MPPKERTQVEAVILVSHVSASIAQALRCSVARGRSLAALKQKQDQRPAGEDARLLLQRHTQKFFVRQTQSLQCSVTPQEGRSNTV